MKEGIIRIEENSSYKVTKKYLLQQLWAVEIVCNHLWDFRALSGIQIIKTVAEFKVDNLWYYNYVGSSTSILLGLIQMVCNIKQNIIFIAEGNIKQNIIFIAEGISGVMKK